MRCQHFVRAAVAVFAIMPFVFLGIGCSSSKTGANNSSPQGGNAVTDNSGGAANPSNSQQPGETSNQADAGKTTAPAVVVEAPKAVEPPKSAVSLHYGFKAGQQWDYASSVSMTMDMSGGAGKSAPRKNTINATEHVMVESVKGDKAAMKITTDAPSVGGRPAAKLEISAVYDKLGACSSYSTGNGAGKDPMSKMMTALDPSAFGFQGLSYPTKALNAGDTWGQPLDLAKILRTALGAKMAKAVKVKSGHMSLQYKFRGLETVGGKQVAVIDVTRTGDASIAIDMAEMMAANGAKGKMPENQPKSLTISLKINLTGTIRADLDSGLPRDAKSTGTVNVDMGAQGSMTQSVEMSTVRK